MYSGKKENSAVMDVNEMIEQKNLFVEHTELNKFVITVPSI